jgi:hypothetical protein
MVPTTLIKVNLKKLIEFKRISYEHFNPHFIATIDFEAQGEQTHLTWHMLFDSEEILQSIVASAQCSRGIETKRRKTKHVLS